MSSLSVSNHTRRKAPRVPFTKIAQAVLPHWEISLAFVGPNEARALNKKLRKKSYTPNVLSYVVGEKSGEIIICPEIAEEQAPAYYLPLTTFYLLLFIHGLLHLEGRRHGPTMEKREQALLEEWSPTALSHVPTHLNRNRHRHVPGKTSRRRRTAR